MVYLFLASFMALLALAISDNTTTTTATPLPAVCNNTYPYDITFGAVTPTGVQKIFYYVPQKDNDVPTIDILNDFQGNTGVLSKLRDIIAFDIIVNDSIAILYWSCRMNNSLYKTSFYRYGDGVNETREIAKSTGVISSIALDWANNLVYFIDRHQTIKVTDTDGLHGVRTVYEEREPIIPGQRKMTLWLRNLVVVAEFGWLYAMMQTPTSDMNGYDYYMVQLSLDGSDLFSTEIGSMYKRMTTPLLLYNYEKKSLFSMFGAENGLYLGEEPSNNVFKYRRIDYTAEKSGPVNVLGASYINNTLFWIGEDRKLRAHFLDCGTDFISSIQSSVPVSEIVSFYEAKWSSVPTSESCSRKCSHFCLTRPATGTGNIISRNCACPDHLKLDSDEARCLIPPAAATLSIVSSSNPGLSSVSIVLWVICLKMSLSFNQDIK